MTATYKLAAEKHARGQFLSSISTKRMKPLATASLPT